MTNSNRAGLLVAALLALLFVLGLLLTSIADAGEAGLIASGLGINAEVAS